VAYNGSEGTIAVATTDGSVMFDGELFNTGGTT
jgi:hypothetical protein